MDDNIHSTKAMREALIAIRDKCQNIAMVVSPLSKKFHSAEIQALNYCFHTSVAALSAPPRNCDVGTVKEQSRRFFAFCSKQLDGPISSCNGCILADAPCCKLSWAQFPCESEVEHGNA